MQSSSTLPFNRRVPTLDGVRSRGIYVQFYDPVFRAVERGHGDGVSVAGCVVRGLSGGLVLRGLVDGVTVAV